MEQVPHDNKMTVEQCISVLNPQRSISNVHKQPHVSFSNTLPLRSSGEECPITTLILSRIPSLLYSGSQISRQSYKYTFHVHSPKGTNLQNVDYLGV